MTEESAQRRDPIPDGVGTDRAARAEESTSVEAARGIRGARLPDAVVSDSDNAVVGDSDDAVVGDSDNVVVGDNAVVSDNEDLDDPYGSEDFPSRPAGPAGPDSAARAYADRAADDAAVAQEATPAAAVPANRWRRRRPSRPRRASRWWEFPVLAIVAVLVAILVKSFLVQPFYIPSESMEKTLHGCAGCNGDKILVNKVVYHSRDPHPGEIVVFRAPDGWETEFPAAPSTNAITGLIRSFGQLVGVIPPDEKDLVKRVIAVGGQTVKCCDAQARVQISENGAAGPWRSLDETYIYRDGPDTYQTFGPVTVPKGRLWVMGDHRNDSSDSRFHCGGSLTACDPTESTVPASRVIGKAFVVAWPISRWRTLGTPETFTSSTGALAASALPLLMATLVVAPIALSRRRKRRRAQPPPVP